MGFYSEIAKDIQWEYTSNVDAYLKIVNGKLQLPQAGWLAYHLRYLDNVIEAINAFRHGQLTGETIKLETLNRHIVRDPGEAVKILRDISNKYKVFSIDIESNNLSTDKTKNKLLMIGVAYTENDGVAFMRECFENKVFRIVFQNFCKRKDFVFILHNGIFDRSRTQIIEGIELKIDEDTMLMHYCGINEHKGTHGLKGLAQLYLGFPDWEKELDDWKHAYCRVRANNTKLSEFGYSLFPQETLALYCCVDVIATFRLYYVFKKLMRPETINIYRKLIEASEYYADMIVRGMRLNEDYWFQLNDELSEQKFNLEDYFDEHLSGVSMTSPIQLKQCLQEHFPNEWIDSTNKDAMNDLVLKYPDDELLTKVLEYRKICKYLQTYVTGLWDRKDQDNIIHCEFKLHGTETGRLSSANPNMQNIPRNTSIKSLFIAHEGYTFIQLDYSQSELRVLAHISNDENLMQCYIDGRDLHTEIQKHLFGDKYDEHNKDQRVIAKTINFGIPYGRTAGGMAKKLKMTKREAQSYLDDWFKMAPKVKDYIEQCHKMALSDPQDVWVTEFGRSRRYYITSDSIHHVKNQSVNFPISSTANDLTIYSVVEIGKWLKENKFDAFLVNTVHDSIIVECRPEDTKVIAEKCQQIMADIPQRYLKNVRMPFRADVEIGDCYGDLAEPEWNSDEEEDE